MKDNKYFKKSIIYFIAFVAFTIMVATVDVKAIGPNGSAVGFATVNKAVFDALGQSEFWYKLTGYMGKTALLICLAFGGIGVVQWIKRGSLKKVDPKIIMLGIFYVVVIVFYVIFNKFAINYRPVLEADGSLEASYPSSHSVLAVCVFVTAFLQDALNQEKTEKTVKWNRVWSIVLPAIMLVGRLLSGVHWFTDIVGALLLSLALINLYKASISRLEPQCK